MRIALVTPEFVTEASFDGGLANYTHRIAKVLAALGHEPVVVTSAGADALITVDGVTVRRVAVKDDREWKIPRLFTQASAATKWKYNMAIHLLWQSWRLNAAVKSLHRRQPFDIVHFAHLEGVGYFMPRSIPSVIRLSSATRLCQEYGGYGTKDSYIRQQEWLERSALRRADGIFGPSRFVASLVEKEVKKPIAIIESPFLPDSAPLDPSVYRATLQGKRYLLFFGSIGLIKGVGTIAEIIHPLLAKHPDLSFAFVGKEVPGQAGGSLLDRVRTNAKEHVNRIIHIDRLRHPQLYPIIAGAHAVVLPSRIDNFPNSCIEAMAHGKVVIGTRGNGFEQLIDHAKSGFLCNVDDPKNLLDTIELTLLLTDQERARLGSLARARIDLLRPEIVGRQLVEFYQAIIDGRRR